ncbi:MAG: DoxX family protein [Flavobacteriaceae bacterium]
MQRILTYCLAAIFLFSGGAKLAGLDFEVRAFERWGYPPAFMYLTGVLEVAGAIGLFVKPLKALAAACLALLMIGAVGTHMVFAEWPMMIMASIILLAAAARAWLGRAEIAALPDRLRGIAG